MKTLALPVLFLALLTTTLPAQETMPRFDPDGISGSLVLCGSGTVPDDVIEYLVRYAGEEAEMVVLLGDEIPVEMVLAEQKRVEKFVGKQTKEPHLNVSIFPLSEVIVGGKFEAAINTIKKADILWFGGGLKTLQQNARLGTACQEVLKGNGLVICSHGAADVLGTHSLSGGKSHKGWNLLPESLVDASSKTPDPLQAALDEKPGRVGYYIGKDAALIVKGRQMKAVGEPVSVHLAKSATRPARTYTLAGRNSFADLTALRRSAWLRTQPEFLAREPRVPEVPKGTLVIIGGGGMPRGMISQFVELAGGKDAHIVVFPTAVPDPIPRRQGIAEGFKRAGAKVTILTQRKLKDVESDEFLNALKTATGLWFGGGRQWRFVDAYRDTKALPLMHAVLQRGGVIGGSSAGASIQAEYLARGNPVGNLDIMAEGYEQGLGFLPGVAVDQHFAQRRRFKDMSALVRAYPQLLGIGIDEATAIIVKGTTAEVTGRNAVHFYDPNRKVKPGEKDYESLKHGGKYDLKERKIIERGKVEEKEAKEKPDTEA